MTTPPSSGTPEKVFSLIHVDRSLLVANKPTRLLSVPGRGPDKQDCLVSRIQTEFPDVLIVHRLDYDTSGLIVLARGKTMHRELSILFQERQVTKRYVAVVDGKPAQRIRLLPFGEFTLRDGRGPFRLEAAGAERVGGRDRGPLRRAPAVPLLLAEITRSRRLRWRVAAEIA